MRSPREIPWARVEIERRLALGGAIDPDAHARLLPDPVGWARVGAVQPFAALFGGQGGRCPRYSPELDRQ